MEIVLYCSAIWVALNNIVLLIWLTVKSFGSNLLPIFCSNIDFVLLWIVTLEVGVNNFVKSDSISLFSNEKLSLLLGKVMIFNSDFNLFISKILSSFITSHNT